MGTAGPKEQRKIVVLVAEDDADNRAVLVLMLEVAGFLAEGVTSVAEAHEAIPRVRPDVLVADYSLEGGTAADLLKGCAAADRPLVCILLTGFAPENVDAAGFDVTLTKPITPSALVEAIRTRAVPSAAT